MAKNIPTIVQAHSEKNRVKKGKPYLVCMVFGEFNLREKVHHTHIYSWQIVYPFNCEISYEILWEHATKTRYISYNLWHYMRQWGWKLSQPKGNAGKEKKNKELQIFGK